MCLWGINLFGGDMSAIHSIFADEAFRTAVVFVGVIVAVASVLTSRSIARKKQSADVLFAMRKDEEMLDGLTCIAKNHNAPDINMRSFAKSENFDSEDSIKIRYVLNNYETISVGIQLGIYDEEMFKRVMYGSLVKAYDRVLPLINAVREEKKRDTIFTEFEWLAKRWKDNPLKVEKQGIRFW